ncbi:MAG: hypothetical protein HRT54_17870 [Colwellia sp.]|nr:hypothetical protein [Colwellia sp.]
MKIKQCLYLISNGYTPEEIVKEMELTESETRDIAIYLGSFLQSLQLESRFQDKCRLLNT